MRLAALARPLATLELLRLLRAKRNRLHRL